MKTQLIFVLVLAAVLAMSASEASAQWYKIPDLQYTSIYCFLATGDSTVFVGGDNGVFLRTTDAGATWTNLITWQNGLEVDTILSLEKAGGYIFAGTNSPGSLYRSSDDGDSWSPIGQGFPANTAINGMTYSNNVIYVAANTGVYSSTDSGNSWNADTVGLNMAPWYEYTITPGGIVGIDAVDSTLFSVESWAWSSSGGVFKTRVDSISWAPIGLDSLPTNGLFAITNVDTNVFVATVRGIYLYSGPTATWLPRNSGLPLNDSTWLGSCIFAPKDTLLFAYISYTSTYVYGREIYVTSDLGQTWKRVTDSSFAGDSVTAMVATNKYLFAGTQSGAWRIPIADVITEVKPNPSQLPAKFTLSQNYPNPFNPTTVINYQLPSMGHVILRVYDVLGREVRTLVDERQDAGTHSVIFNAANLPSGVYFYELVAQGVNIIRKMVLEK